MDAKVDFSAVSSPSGSFAPQIPSFRLKFGVFWSKFFNRPDSTFLSAIIPHQMRPSDPKSEKLFGTPPSSVPPLLTLGRPAPYYHARARNIISTPSPPPSTKKTARNFNKIDEFGVVISSGVANHSSWVRRSRAAQTNTPTFEHPFLPPC